MRFLDEAVDLTARLSSRTPYFRGLGTLIRHFNSAVLKLGAAPLTNARMQDGTVLRVDLRSHTEVYAKYLSVYDGQLIELVKGLMDSSGDFVDVGANVGFYTIALGAFLREAGQGGQVVAFEPHEGNFHRLLENIAINKLEAVAHAHQLGLSNSEGRAELTLREDFTAGASTGNAAIATNPEFDSRFRKISIPLARLDDVCRHFREGGRRISFVKVDIEGHEDFFLEGAQEILTRARPIVLMEVNKPYYAARGVDLDARFFPLLPGRYLVLRSVSSVWTRIKSLTECAELDNVILLPEEQIGSDKLAALVRQVP